MRHSDDPCAGCRHSTPSTRSVWDACWRCLGYDLPKIDWAAKAQAEREEWEQRLREAGEDMLL